MFFGPFPFFFVLFLSSFLVSSILSRSKQSEVMLVWAFSGTAQTRPRCHRRDVGRLISTYVRRLHTETRRLAGHVSLASTGARQVRREESQLIRYGGKSSPRSPGSTDAASHQQLHHGTTAEQRLLLGHYNTPISRRKYTDRSFSTQSCTVGRSARSDDVPKVKWRRVDPTPWSSSSRSRSDASLSASPAA